MKLWGARFNKNTNELVDEFNNSISFDKRLYKEDILGSIAHAKMLGKQGIITEKESQTIINELENILKDYENKKIDFSKEYEDIHMNVEKILTDRIGDIGKKLHTARSRNDQVALDMKMFAKNETKKQIELLKELILTLIEISKEHLDTIMSGYTHLQHAQVITFAHFLLAYANMFKRDIMRLKNSLYILDEMPLGACALATTTHNIDRNFVKDELSFDRITDNSLDSVSDRDYLLELLSAFSIIMMHLSRLAEELIIYNTSEFNMIELDDAFSTGSSIMPQKKNPDVLELIRGKTGRVYGDLITMLTVLKGLPLAYNKDMQEDKECFFDAVDTLSICIKTIIPLLSTMTVKKEEMLKQANKGFLNATDCADYLVKKGLPFREAYKIVGQIVKYAVEKNKTLNEITIDEYKNYSDKFDKDIYEFLDLNYCVNSRKVEGGPSKTDVLRQIKVIEDFLKKIN